LIFRMRSLCSSGAMAILCMDGRFFSWLALDLAS
jgi:hypothetical protein